MQEKNKNLLDNLDTKIKSVEKNLTNNLNENTNTKYKEYSNGINILFELLLGFLIGGFLGYYIDIMLATMPVFLLIGIFLGGIIKPCDCGPFYGGTVLVRFFITSASNAPTFIARLITMTRTIAFHTYSYHFFCVIKPIAPFAPLMPKLALQAIYKRCL